MNLQMLEYHLVFNNCLLYDINNLDVIVIHVRHFFSSSLLFAVEARTTKIKKYIPINIDKHLVYLTPLIDRLVDTTHEHM